MPHVSQNHRTASSPRLRPELIADGIVAGYIHKLASATCAQARQPSARRGHPAAAGRHPRTRPAVARRLAPDAVRGLTP